MSVHAATRAAHARARPIQISLPEPMAVRMEERARALGRGLTDYARLLLEAAYAARCAQDKGETSYDAELGRQVRLAFLMADCEPDYIAEALGMPKPRVKRILEGWRRVEGDLREGAMQLPPAGASAPAKAPAKAPASAPAKAKPADGGASRNALLRAAHGKTIAELWAAGASYAEIGAATGTDADQIRFFARHNRDVCPARPKGRPAKAGAA